MRGARWILAGLAPVALGANTPPSDPVMPMYEPVRAALAADDLAATRSAATAMSTANPPELDAAAAALATSADLASARTRFGELSRQTVLWYGAHGLTKGIVVYHCPMTSDWAYWLQPHAGISNPYMGQAMPKCGEGVAFKEAEKAAETVP